MKLGAAIVMQNPQRRQADHDVWWDEIALADLVEPLGFDSLWSVEHHFTDYMLIPDVLQLLTFMAARTSRVMLGTAVKVLPWQDPVRVAEQVACLDVLSRGRVILGVGRGSGRIEFEGLRVPMAESRDRFKECAEILLAALSQERFSYAGRYYQIPELSVRPRPYSDLTDRIYGAAVSPESAELMAQLGFGCLIIPQRDWDSTALELERSQAVHRRLGREPKPPVTLSWVYVGESEDEARASALEYMGEYWRSSDVHYELSKGAHKDVKTYEFYQQTGDIVARAGQATVVDNFIAHQVVGTAQQCIDKMRFIVDKVKTDHMVSVFRYGGMPLPMAERSMRRFADQVMPALRSPR